MDKAAWQRYFGCKTHIVVAVGHKLIWGYRLTAADVHDSRVFEELPGGNTSRAVWADSAYRWAKRPDWLRSIRVQAYLGRKGPEQRPLREWERQGNKAAQGQPMGDPEKCRRPIHGAAAPCLGGTDEACICRPRRHGVSGRCSAGCARRLRCEAHNGG